MSSGSLLERIENTELGTAIRESVWLFPTLETLHVLAIVLVVGTILMIDLRLLNIASRERSVTEIASEVLPWTWVSFVVAVISGTLLFISSAERYFENIPFRVKMLLLLCAGVNMAVFHLITYRGVRHWDSGAPTPLGARIAGGLSLVIWVSVVTFGRWIGFV